MSKVVTFPAANDFFFHPGSAEERAAFESSVDSRLAETAHLQRLDDTRLKHQLLNHRDDTYSPVYQYKIALRKHPWITGTLTALVVAGSLFIAGGLAIGYEKQPNSIERTTTPLAEIVTLNYWKQAGRDLVGVEGGETRPNSKPDSHTPIRRDHQHPIIEHLFGQKNSLPKSQL